VTDLECTSVETAAVLESRIAARHEVVLIDGLNDAHLLRAGALIDGLAAKGLLFSVGSSGIESALTPHWTGFSPPNWPAPRAALPLLVISGSCSPVTAGQIDWAIANGFTGIAFQGESSTAAAVTALRAGRNVVVYTSRGEAGAPIPASVLGAQLGRLAREAVAQAGVKRLVIAGGDTSSYAGRALGIESLTMIAPLIAGAPWSRATAPGSPADGLEIMFKGGQVGAPDCFGAAARGKI
jgi:3-oxoisoapionate kinase